MATVLVVDDDRVVAQLVAAVLRGKGHKVFTAFDAVQGLMQVKQKPSVDAIVFDVNMPGGSGEETLRKIKMSTHTQNIPPFGLRRGRRVSFRGGSSSEIRPLPSSIQISVAGRRSPEWRARLHDRTRGRP